MQLYIIYVWSIYLSQIYLYQVPDVISPLTHSSGKCMQRLNIDSKNLSTIMDGSLLTWMLETGIPDFSFPSARFLRISINDLGRNFTLPEKSLITAVHNIEIFLQHIRSMVPNVKSADITWPNIVLSNANQGLGTSISDSVNNLLYGIKSLRFIECKSANEPSQLIPGYFSGLTHLCYKFNDGYTWFTELVRHNVGTLEVLKTSHMPNDYLKQLLHDSNSKPVVYPFIKVLELVHIAAPSQLSSVVPNTTNKPSDNSADHFPLLETFAISGYILFIDNVFKPGINITLRNLSVSFYRYSLGEIGLFQKYEPTQLCNLISISVSGGHLMAPDYTNVYDGEIEFLRSSLNYTTDGVIKLFYRNQYRGNSDMMFAMSVNAFSDNLKSLTLHFSKFVNTHSPILVEFKVVFPSLHTLDVTNYYNESVFISSVLSKNLTTIKLTESHLVIQQLQQSFSTIASNPLTLSIADQRPGDKYTVLDQYFGSNPILTDTRLDLDMDIYFTGINWCKLAFLVIKSEYHFSEIFELVSRLSGLRHMSFLHASTYDLVLGIPFNIISYMNMSNLPVNQNVECLALANIIDSPDDLYLELFLFILRQLPNVRVFKTYAVSQDLLYEFLSNNGAEYPPLKNIVIEKLATC